MRIVSFLPSATEILFGLGLGDQVLAVSHECDWPPEARSKPVAVRAAFRSADLSAAEIDRIVSGRMAQGLPIYEIDQQVLQQASPDLIVTQELCDVCAIGLRDVMKAIYGLPSKPSVLSLDPRNLTDVLDTILQVGEATGTRQRAQSWREALSRRVEAVRSQAQQASAAPRVVCLEWLDPPMASGHWVPEMVRTAGGHEALGREGEPSVKVPWERVLEAHPDVLLLMPCGYDVPATARQVELLRRLPGWSDIPAVRSGRVYACNGNAIFSRSGPRLVDGVELLAQILHPDLFGSKLDSTLAARLDAGVLAGRP
jgi:iron complex transport system substrate-binding protein